MAGRRPPGEPRPDYESPRVDDLWSVPLEVDRELNAELVEMHGGWPSDDRPILYRIGDVLAKYALIFAACGAALLLAKLLGLPIG
jgi:hypothetical protein